MAKAFPNLVYDSVNRRIVGEINFSALYVEECRKLVINPAQNLIDKHPDEYIKDCYSVQIRLSESDWFGLPNVYDIDRRAEKIAEQDDGIESVNDLHVDKSGCCCLGIFTSDEDVEKYCELREFLDLVINFLYYLSFRATFKKWPWKGYAHGLDGIAEYANDFKISFGKKHGRNEICPCGSGKKYKRCCIGSSTRLRMVYNQLRARIGERG